MPWLGIGIGVALAGLAIVLFLLRDRLPFRKPPTTVIPLGRGLRSRARAGTRR